MSHVLNFFLGLTGSVVFLTAADKPICLGTVIAPMTVLTAAHCLVDPLGSRVPDQVLHRSGRRAAIVGARIHPGYSRFSLGRDLAVVQLGRSLGVPVARIADGPLPGLSDKIRIGLRGRWATVIDTNDGLIQIQTAGKSPCHGDSGGPGVVKIGSTEAIIGIVSHGEAACTGAAFLTGVDGPASAFLREYLRTHAGKKAPTGDGCQDDETCAWGPCLQTSGSERYCSQSCRTTHDCPSPMTCRDALCRFAEPIPGATGSPCVSDGDCRSLLCVAADRRSASICTVGCSPSRSSQCPRGFACVGASRSDVAFVCLESQ